MGARWTPLQLVNDIRAAVLNWAEEGYPGITQTSRNLINHYYFTNIRICNPPPNAKQPGAEPPCHNYGILSIFQSGTQAGQPPLM